MEACVTKNRIKELRARHGLTQEQLANQVGVRRETIVHVEPIATTYRCSWRTKFPEFSGAPLRMSLCLLMTTP